MSLYMVFVNVVDILVPSVGCSRVLSSAVFKQFYLEVRVTCQTLYSLRPAEPHVQALSLIHI